MPTVIGITSFILCHAAVSGKQGKGEGGIGTVGLSSYNSAPEQVVMGLLDEVMVCICRGATLCFRGVQPMTAAGQYFLYICGVRSPYDT